MQQFPVLIWFVSLNSILHIHVLIPDIGGIWILFSIPDMNVRTQENSCLSPGHLLIFHLSDCFPLKVKKKKKKISLVIHTEILITEANF